MSSTTASQLISHLTASDQHTSISQEYDLTAEDAAELEALQREFDAQQEEEEVTQELSKDLIAKRVLTKSILDEGEQAISTALSTLTHYHLDGMHLSSITCLTPYTQLTHLYLQRNSITDITPISSLTNLTFLALMYNHIHDLAPLTPLTELLFLDVSHNDIITFEIESLPDSLRVFNCKENPLEETSDAWKHDVLTHLDLLKKWDDIEVTREYRLQLGVEVSDDESSDTEEERKPPPVDTHATTLHNLDVDEAVESVHDMTHSLMERSKQRMKQYQQEHTSTSSSSSS